MHSHIVRLTIYQHVNDRRPSLKLKKGVPRLLVSLAILLLIVSCDKRNVDGPKESIQSKNFVFPGKPTSDIIFLSTQMNPLKEAGKMRDVILKDFPGKVDFRPNDNSYRFRQIKSVLLSNPSEAILIGALHGDLVKLYEENALQPLNDIFSGLEKEGVFGKPGEAEQVKRKRYLLYTVDAGFIRHGRE